MTLKFFSRLNECKDFFKINSFIAHFDISSPISMDRMQSAQGKKGNVFNRAKDEPKAFDLTD